MTFPVKCISVQVSKTMVQSADANGLMVLKDGYPVWVPATLWTIQFSVLNMDKYSFRVQNGSVELLTSRPEVASKYKLDGVYDLELTEPTT